MRQKSVPVKEPATQVVKNIRRATRRHFSAEDKIRIVLEGLRGEDSIAELCRREGIVQNLYYRWSKDFLEGESEVLSYSENPVWVLHQGLLRAAVDGIPVRLRHYRNPPAMNVNRISESVGDEIAPLENARDK